tara:strand:- start:659 stop:787 length:129 start_codon:yes stop_codon:yes gene_type:complete
MIFSWVYLAQFRPQLPQKVKVELVKKAISGFYPTDYLSKTML